MAKLKNEKKQIDKAKPMQEQQPDTGIVSRFDLQHFMRFFFFIVVRRQMFVYLWEQHRQ